MVTEKPKEEIRTEKRQQSNSIQSELTTREKNETKTIEEVIAQKPGQDLDGKNPNQRYGDQARENDRKRKGEGQGKYNDQKNNYMYQRQIVHIYHVSIRVRF